MYKWENVKSRLRSGKPILMAFLTSTDPSAAELLAIAGVDIVILDNEHICFTDTQIQHSALAVTSHGKACILRTPIKSREALNRWMEFGLSGICATQCHGLSDAMAVIEAVKYPPVGKRGLGAEGRAAGCCSLHGMSRSEYMEYANRNTFVYVTLEDAQALSEAAQIAALDEIDGVHIGPVDLAASMGSGGDFTAEPVQRAIASAEAAIKAAGNRTASIISDPAQTGPILMRGGLCLVLESEAAMLYKAYSAHVSAFTAGLAQLESNRCLPSDR